jgi:hypothetical protein
VVADPAGELHPGAGQAAGLAVDAAVRPEGDNRAAISVTAGGFPPVQPGPQPASVDLAPLFVLAGDLETQVSR